MRPVPLVLAAIALLSLPLLWLGLRAFLPEPARLDVPGGPGIDSGARIEIELMRQQIEALQGDLQELREELSEVASRPVAQPAPPLPPADGARPFQNQGPNAIIDAYASTVLIANRRQVNNGITVATPQFLEAFLGRPREVLSDTCEPMTNPKLRALLVTQQVGPIRVSMLQPALDSLTRIFAKIEAADPDLYARINTAGALCVRQIRGSSGRTSTHAFGLAVDLNIDGQLDTLADGKTQLGLTIIADFFNKEGWVWGAAFGREDSMHFEVSRQQLETWRAEGKI